MSKIILFDIPCKGRTACWSFNIWRTRFVLNYKNIPYETKWIEYPDLAPTFKSFGIPPAASDTKYSSPTVQFLDDSTYLMDSARIADELERRFPTPGLHINSPYSARVRPVLAKIHMALVAEFIPRVATNLLNPQSKEFFDRTRALDFGMPLEQVAIEQGGEKCWAKAAMGLDQLAALLKENTSGPFLEGKELCYADVIVVTWLQFAKRIDEKTLFERVLATDPSIAQLYKACEQYFIKDS